VTECLCRYVVAGLARVQPHWKLTRAEARDYMITACDVWSKPQL
jgi:hypothetical protein